MSKSSLKIGEILDADHKINPHEQQTIKVTLEETPIKFSVSTTTTSVKVLSALTPSPLLMPPCWKIQQSPNPIS